jgi:hypothetical protein
MVALADGKLFNRGTCALVPVAMVSANSRVKMVFMDQMEALEVIINSVQRFVRASWRRVLPP